MEASVHRLFIERKDGFDNEAKRTREEITSLLGIQNLAGVRYCNRYDLEGIDAAVLDTAASRVFSEPQSDRVYREILPVSEDETVITIEYLPGQYDQRADSAGQCLALIPGLEGKNVLVRCARVYILSGNLTSGDLERIRNYLINPVDSREADSAKPATLAMKTPAVAQVPVLSGFTAYSAVELSAFRVDYGLAMDDADIVFLQQYFQKEGRDPTETEIRVLDTYWSDHCRHTTFNTILDSIDVEDGPYAETVREALNVYTNLRAELHSGRDKPVTLMDMAVIGAKALRKRGLLDDLEESAEINACSIFIDVTLLDEHGARSGTESWLLMFKNETHNHPTEIEPFGGAATCIGGAIRDPLSGRAWVYQALRVTGAGDPTVPLKDTLPGKLPQISLTRGAAAGFSAYGNQIGLTTGQVVEYYDPGFLAKRMELGAVIAATPVSSVVREEPEAGDVVIMVGGGTGRDGIGGATGSSKAHTAESVTEASAEVQKGNAVEERKIQRLFRDPAVTRLIRRCNDFGAGGVSVAVGELAPSLDIDLSAVPKKYEGLNGTELAISESQERMAVVVREKDAPAFIAAANRENLNAAVIARVTDTGRLVMRWQGDTIVNIDREFLDTAGAKRNASVTICQPSAEWNWQIAADKPFADRWYSVLADLSVASQRGLTERFDGSIGSSSILFPAGGSFQATPECGMAARIPVGPGKETSTVSLMTMGYDPKAASWSPFHAAQYAVLESLVKILALGGDPRTARLTFQEYFERTSSPEAWGKPAAALLGALQAQLGAGTASIGGKDSMSGTFHDITVPPTLVSFAVAVTDQEKVRGGAFTGVGNAIVLVQTPWKKDRTPDWNVFHKTTEALLALAETGSVHAAYPVTAGGIAAAVTKMAFGNRIGAALDTVPLSTLQPQGFGNDPAAALFAPCYGSLILEVSSADILAFSANCPEASNWKVIGKTLLDPVITYGEHTINLDRAQTEWERPLAKVFPPVSSTNAADSSVGELPSWALNLVKAGKPDAPAGISTAKAKPLVVLPVFPGTNCEYDMARAFALSGAETRLVVLRNRTAADLEESLAELASAIQDAQILAFSGGFSAGDEPDGSGKFIANILREQVIADRIMDLAGNRDGLILGICNGFQALIKVGLIPYGEIREPSADMPTLTYNTVGRHISRFVRTRITSDKSPWASGTGLAAGSIHEIPVSHGEGRVILDAGLAEKLFAYGQVFTQYVDRSGKPTMVEPDNPNGSLFAIEGLTDETGRILGKMGHSERAIDTEPGGKTRHLFKNIPGDTCENIFAAGVRYFL